MADCPDTTTDRIGGIPDVAAQSECAEYRNCIFISGKQDYIDDTLYGVQGDYCGGL
jgi:hypothetical protein